MSDNLQRDTSKTTSNTLPKATARMSSSSNTCPLCNRPVEGDSRQLERHVNSHLDAGEDELSRKVAVELAEGAPSQDLTRATSANRVDDLVTPAERMMLEVEQNDAALASALAQSPEMSNGSSEYVSQSLRGSLSDSAERYYPHILRRFLPRYDSLELLKGKRVHVCSRLDLFCSNIAGLGWDCGYRNIQMLFSALLQNLDTAPQLKAAGITEVPSVPEIAGRIESAWRNGFDPEGAANFDGTLTDKAVWIGATEAFVLFKSIDMNANLTDFETPTAEEKRGLYEWIFKYFAQSCNGKNCSVHSRGFLSSGKPALVAPIFCQWQGHSVTIIGAEKNRGGDINLLILDPSRGFYTSLMGGADVGLQLLRRDVSHPQFSHPRFQFVSVLPKKTGTVTPIRQSRKGVLGRIRLGGGPS